MKAILSAVRLHHLMKSFKEEGVRYILYNILNKNYILISEYYLGVMTRMCSLLCNAKV